MFDHRDLAGPRAEGLRPALLRELAELYVEKPRHSEEEERLFTELALRLIPHVDAADRAWLGATLAAYPGAPRAVIAALESDPSRLKRALSPFVPAQAGIQTTNTGPALSRGRTESDSVAMNPTLGEAADKPPLLPRIEGGPRPADDLSESFFSASAEERRLILLNLDYAPVPPAPLSVTADDAEARLEAAALTRDGAALAQALAQLLAVPQACALRLAQDRSGEALIAALKALSLPAPALQRILLFLAPADGAHGRYFALVRLYDEIGETAARRLVTLWRGGARPAAMPAADERMSRARDHAMHSARRAISRATENPRRGGRMEP